MDSIFKKGYDNKLQKRFPEGKLFSNAIFSLSIIEYCNKQNLIEEEYSKILDQNIKRILSKRARDNFNSDLQPKYGIFYNGWTNYVLTKYQSSKLYQFSTIKNQIDSISTKIENRIIKTQTDSLRILNSYAQSNWPADNLIGMISIKNDSIQNAWLNLIFQTAEHESGLIHHSGGRKSRIRGSSQALISFCLNEINYTHLKEYNKEFKDLFIKEYLGIQMVKENEDGSNQMDVDSGPVILGFGASGTIMNIKTQASLGDPKTKRCWALMNTIGFPINLSSKKYYLLKKEPMFDIFMLWSSVEL